MSYCSSSSSVVGSVVLVVLVLLVVPVVLASEARYAATGALSRAVVTRRALPNARRRTARS